MGATGEYEDFNATTERDGMKEKDPFYNWYASDFLGSPFVQSLSLIEECCYRRLLDMQAMSDDGRISEDMRALRGQCKNLPMPQWLKIWDRLKVKFIPHPDGKTGLVNPKLHDRLSERRAFLSERSQSGKAGAKSRWNKETVDGSANSSAIVLANGSANGKPHGETMASTPIPIPTPKGEGNNTGNKQGDGEGKGNAPPAPVTPPVEAADLKIERGEHGNVKLTHAEYLKLETVMGEPFLRDYIGRLDEYKIRKPAAFAAYKDHYRVLLTWHGKDSKASESPPPLRFEITPDLRDFAQREGITLDLGEDAARWLDHRRAKGEKRVDWLADFRGWLRNSKQFDRKGNANGKQESPAQRRSREQTEACERVLADYVAPDAG